MARAEPAVVEPAIAALAAARDRLLALQHGQGWWRGEVKANVTIEASDLLLREFLGIREDAATARTAAWVRSCQRSDGTWANFHGGPPDLSTTIEGYLALRLAGDAPEGPHMRRAAAFVRAAGGIERARAFTHVWLALFGLWPWERVRALPAWLMLLPAWSPLNIDSFANWARLTIVPLTIVTAERPVRSLPWTVDELRSEPPRRRRTITRRGTLLRHIALARAEHWILRRQDADGAWGGIQPAMVYSLLALHLRGYSLRHPAMRAGLNALESYVVDEDGMRRVEVAQSPVWDTALAVIALRDGGLSADHPALVRAADWLLSQEIRTRGDWTARRRDLEPSGWTFQFENDHYPDVDDTAEAVMALRRVAHPERRRVDTALARARRWTIGMQCVDGGWAAFDADSAPVIGRIRLPFLDFGDAFDLPSVDVTAHALEMLAGEGLAESPAARAAVRWLLARQEAGGSWLGRWGVNHVYGIGTALPALVAAGLPRDDARIRRAVRWLVAHQNDDGGWGEDARSYEDPAWIGKGPSTPSQTAWALLALHAAGEDTERTRRGVAWLVANQRPDGGWDESLFTGTGFPGDFYLSYELYPLTFPLMALGRLLEPTA